MKAASAIMPPAAIRNASGSVPEADPCLGDRLRFVLALLLTLVVGGLILTFFLLVSPIATARDLVDAMRDFTP